MSQDYDLPPGSAQLMPIEIQANISVDRVLPIETKNRF